MNVKDSKLTFSYSPGRVLGKHCGNSLPAPLDTGDSFAYVKFVSDGNGNAAGFSLSFEASVEGKCLLNHYSVQLGSYSPVEKAHD